MLTEYDVTIAVNKVDGYSYYLQYSFHLALKLPSLVSGIPQTVALKKVWLTLSKPS